MKMNDAKQAEAVGATEKRSLSEEGFVAGTAAGLGKLQLALVMMNTKRDTVRTSHKADQPPPPLAHSLNPFPSHSPILFRSQAWGRQGFLLTLNNVC